MIEDNKSNEKSLGFSFFLTYVFAIVLGIIGCGFGGIFLMLPVSSGLFAYCFLRNDAFRYVRIITLAILLIPTFFFDIYYFILALWLFSLAFLLSALFKHKVIHPDVTLALTFVSIGFIVLFGVVFLAKNTDSASIDSLIQYVSGLCDGAYNYVAAVYQNTENPAVYSEVLATYKSTLSLVPSILPAILIIAAFIITGVSMKAFKWRLKATYRKDGYVKTWNFVLPECYAVFYLILFAVNKFFFNVENLFGIIVLNLYLVFLVVFGYMGIRFLAFIISCKKNKRSFLYVFFIIVLIIASVCAFQILSLIGAVMIIMANRMSNRFYDDGEV